MESQNTNVGGGTGDASSIQSEFTVTIAPSDALFSSQFSLGTLLEEILNNRDFGPRRRVSCSGPP